MKRQIGQVIIFIFLFIFSYQFLNNSFTATYMDAIKHEHALSVSSNDPLYAEIEQKAHLYEEDPVDAAIDPVWKAIPGYNGLQVDIHQSYQDVRKFGTMHLFPKGEEERFPPLSELGVEPFSKQFTLEFLYHKLQKTKRTIKTTLLDQKIVVGIGNIYADEALFRAGIHPLTAASEIAKDKAAALHEAIRMTLKKAVEEGGTTVRSYVNGAGDMGMFQQYLYVYGRKNEPCRRCQTMIEKIKVGGRGTHYCPKCQK